MARVLRMPEVAANATEAVLAQWLVEERGEFAAGDTIATVETDKALVDVEADATGVVLRTLVPSSVQVEVGAPIAVLGDVGEVVPDIDALLEELGVALPEEHVRPARRDVPPVDPGSGAPVAEALNDAPPEPEAAPSGEPPPSTEPTSSVEPVETTTATSTQADPTRNGRVFSSPLARRLAAEAGIPLAEITGTGPRRRVLRRDVEAAVASRTSAPAAAPAAPLAPAPEPSPAAVDVPHTRLRRAIAARLTESKQTAPHFYLRSTVRAERLLALRAEVNEGATTRISVNDVVLKAVAAAHLRVPEMNVVWTPDTVRTHDRVDVAVAVATDRGLLTPVLRDVAALSVTGVAARVQDLAARAREGRLRQDELEGGTISVTNLGMYGVEEFAAIINPPHAAILAVGAVRDEPVVEDGVVVAGKVMTVTVSVDHRPVDGVVGARWLAALTELLEHPLRALA